MPTSLKGRQSGVVNTFSHLGFGSILADKTGQDGKRIFAFFHSSDLPQTNPLGIQVAAAGWPVDFDLALGDKGWVATNITFPKKVRAVHASRVKSRILLKAGGTVELFADVNLAISPFDGFDGEVALSAPGAKYYPVAGMAHKFTLDMHECEIDTIALYLDKDKNVLGTETVPAGGFIILVNEETSKVRIYRIGRKFVNDGERKQNYVFVEERLALELSSEERTVEMIVQKIKTAAGENPLVEQDEMFAKGIVEAFVGTQV